MANPIAGTIKSNIPFVEHFKLDSLSRIANLVKSANPPNISEQVSIERYYDSIRVMFNMAGSYFNDLQIEKAFILYVRLTQFVNQEMPKHSHYTTLRQEKVEQLKYWTGESKRMYTALKEQIQQTYDEDTQILAESVEEYLNNKDQQSRNTQLRESLEKMQEGTSLRSTVKASFLNSLSQKPDSDETTSASEMNEHLAKIIQTKKTMIAPSDLCKSFAAHVKEACTEGLKVCGILCGGWIRDKFVLTHIIVPKQKGTSTACQAIDKDQVFECQKENNLIACGWILTDPSNKLSLTANELHTQYAYQRGMQYSVSVIVSPTEHTGKFFSLTEDGMDLISECNKHGEKCLQTQAKTIYREVPHVILGKSLRYDVSIMILPADNFPAIDIYRLVDMIVLQSENKIPPIGPFTILDTNDQEDYMQDHIIQGEHYNKHLLSRHNYENNTLKGIRAGNKTLLIYGEGSGFTTNVLRERGFNAIMVSGNIREYKKLFPKGLLSSSGTDYNILKLKETILKKRQEKNGSRLWRSTSASRLRTASRDTRSRGTPVKTVKPWK